MSTVADNIAITWNYTLADIESMSWRAVRLATRNGWQMLNSEDAHDAAWHAIAEQLYRYQTVEPDHWELVKAGASAIQEEWATNQRHHGYNRAAGGFGAEFIKCWVTPIRSYAHDDGFSDRMCERLALPQVLDALTDQEHQTLVTLAAFGTQRAAATALGISEALMGRRVKGARAHALEVWFSPEIPPRSRTFNDLDHCAHGHSREHSYRDNRGGLICRMCKRNADRRTRADGVSARDEPPVDPTALWALTERRAPRQAAS